MGLINGLLLVDKPRGWTSFDVVAYVRNIAAKLENKKPKNVKVGHIGTLDPEATGLLVLCVGLYTKKVPELIKKDKTYEVEITLGKNSNTGDAEGTLTDVSSNKPNKDEVIKAANDFVGVQMQTPPIFSAIKINGKRAYELAREGKEVILNPREVTIYEILNISYEYPLVRFTTSVSSGTYIRSLVESIGEKLQTGAYMSNLRRTAIGNFNIDNAISPKSLTEENLQNTLVKN
jgi:tRNA pseudouridine55 synthase